MINESEEHLFSTIHQSVKRLEKIGKVDKKTMRNFDSLCLPKFEELNPSEIKKIRISENVSQSVFARFLDVSKNLISQWERGEKKPSKMGIKLLSIIKKHGLGVLN